MLRVTQFISEEMLKLPTQSRQEKVLKEVIYILFKILMDKKSTEEERVALGLYGDQILEFDLPKLFEMSFASDNLTLMERALRIYGLFVASKQTDFLIFQQNQYLHRLVVQNIISTLDIAPPFNDISQPYSEHRMNYERELVNKRRTIVKCAFWLLSNIAAIYPDIDKLQVSEGNEDECFLRDDTIGIAIEKVRPFSFLTLADKRGLKLWVH